MQLKSRMEFDGCILYTVRLRATRPTSLRRYRGAIHPGLTPGARRLAARPRPQKSNRATLASLYMFAATGSLLRGPA